MIGTVITIGALSFRVIGHPPYAVAHPEDCRGLYNGGIIAFLHFGQSCDPEVCERCAIATRIDTGEHVLLWLCGGINWSISRHDPNCERHRTAAAL